jgi:type IV pilus assembly protein PilP
MPFLRSGVCIIALALLSGCIQDLGDLHEYVAEVKSRKARIIPPLPEFKPYVPSLYQGSSERNPFIPNVVWAGTIADEENSVVVGPRPIPGRKREPLENFPLDGLRMLGSIKSSGEVFALMRSSEPLVYRVGVGNYIGQNHGRIVQVAETTILLIELIPDGSGRWDERLSSLSLVE